MKKNRNSGFTIVELLVAMSISLIIITGVGQFMVTSSNHYEAVDNQVKLQMEAQSVINCITDMILEANNVAYQSDDQGAYCFIYANLGEKISDDSVADRYTAEQRIVWLNKKEKKIYLFHCYNKDDYDKAMKSHEGKQLMAEGIENLTLAIENVDGNTALGMDGVVRPSSEKKPLVHVEVELASKVLKSADDKSYKFEYTASDSVAIRNQIVPLS